MGVSQINSKASWSLAALLVGAACAAGQDKSPIRFPSIAQPVTPTPAPSNVDVTLPVDAWYVIESDVPVMVFTSPGGAVKVTKEEGPQRFRGRFVGGNGAVESRRFDGKHLVIIEAAAEGRDELLVMPVGATSEAQARRVFLRVGTMPQPPPGPGPKPDVKPVVNSFRVLFVVESAQTLTAKQNSAIYAAAVRDYLAAKTTKGANGQNGWVVVDKDTTLDKYEPTMNRMWQAVQADPKFSQSVPFVAVEINGVVELLPLPQSAEESLKLLKSKRGE